MINDSRKAITAEDIIRRYNLEGLKTDRKVIKQITTTIENQYTTIKNFVINLAPYTNQTDTTVWFSNGVPNLNDPLFENIDTNKVNICYDRDNGVAYKLENNSWVVINDNTLLQSLAIASAEPDAEDKKRNVFYYQPVPPYAVGDLWLDGDTIMRCRSSRDGDDFNNAEWVTQENYSSINVLLDVRAVLDKVTKEVYEDFATKVQLETSVDGINSLVSETRTLITSTNDDLQQYKTEVSSQFEQTAHNFEMSFTNLTEVTDELLEEVQKNSVTNYMRYTDNGTLIIGRSDSDYKVEITNEGLNIVQGDGADNKVAYFNNNKMYITNAEIINNLQLGNFAYTPRANGSLSFGKNK